MKNEFNLIYINKKYKDLVGYFGIDQLNIYLDYYLGSLWPTNLSNIFSLLHGELNRLFDYLNYRIRTGHYTADESRKLLYIISELKTFHANLKRTEFSFEMIPEYQEHLKMCAVFLQESGGSSIPLGFEKINLVENRPIFVKADRVSIDNSSTTVNYNLTLAGGGSYAQVYSKRQIAHT